ncbi:MAG: hypothetical protein IJW99_11675, partial [Clostridia bacterium]|nr:hypothetical protein [Clostridia bacterium]
DFRRVKGTLQKRVPLWVQGKALPSSAPRYLHPDKPKFERCNRYTIRQKNLDKFSRICYYKTVNRGRHPSEKTVFAKNFIEQGGDTHRKKRDCGR